LWLELGPSERNEISRKQLVAACSRVAAIRPEIIQKLHATLQRIVPEKAAQFASMMSNPHMMRVAMDMVVGTEKYVTDATALSAYDKLRAEMVSESETTAREEKRKLRKKHYADLAQAQLALDAQTAKADVEKDRRRVATAKLAEVLLQPYERRGSGAAWAFLACGLVGASGALVGLFFSPVDETIRYAGYVAALVFAGGSFYGWNKGLIQAFFRSQGRSKVANDLAADGHLLDGERLDVTYECGGVSARILDKAIEFQLSP
jgi:hypothetical protein